MTIYDWPRSVLDPRAVAFNPRGMSVGGPPSLTGRTQIASTDAGYWIASFSRVAAGGATGVKLFRSLRALLEGGAHQIRVPVYDQQQAPWSAAGEETGNAVAQVPHDDEAYFDDNSGYYQPSIDIYVSTAAALRATQISATIRRGAALTGGEYFSIGDRLHVIRQVLSVSGSVYSLAIWPPLREAAAVGAEMNFDRPVCRMRLQEESSSDIALDLGRVGFADMNFIEVF